VVTQEKKEESTITDPHFDSVFLEAFKTCRTFKEAAEFCTKWCLEQQEKAKAAGKSKNKGSSTYGRPVAGLSTNIRVVIAKGLELRREKWPNNEQSKVSLETEKGTILESPQITDEANYVFYFLANLIAECSMSSGITMASLRSIFGLAKLLIHAERLDLNEY